MSSVSAKTNFYQMIKPVYNGSYMEVVGKDKNGKKVIKEDYSHEPYFYVPEEEYVPSSSRITKVETTNNIQSTIAFPIHGSIKRRKIKRIFVKSPTDVPDLRQEFSQTWESHLKYRRRWLIDTGIKSGFDDNLNPVDYELPPSICVIDIEVLNEKNQDFEIMRKRANERIVLVTLYFSGTLRPIVICVDNAENRHEIQERPDKKIIFVRTETELLYLFWKLVRLQFPDVITGWNVDFDIEYLQDRSKKLAELSGKHCRLLKKEFELKFIKYINIFDSMESYNKLYKPVRKGLKYIEKELGISNRTDESGSKFNEMYFTDQERAIQYNVDDVMGNWKIIHKTDLIAYFWEDKNFTGVEDLRLTLYNSIKIDTVCLRVAHGRFALPIAKMTHQKKDKSGKPKYKGATVLDPTRGIHFYVGLLDFSRFYPAMIKTKNISYEIPVGAVQQGFIPEIVDIFWEARDRVEAELKKVKIGSLEYKILKPKKMSRKFLLNALYGVLGDPTFRLHDNEKAGMTTKLCRLALDILIAIVKKMGYTVLYGDTDSVYIKLLKKFAGSAKQLVKKMLKISRKVERKINTAFEKVFKTKLINVKLESIWNPLCLTEVKKKYFGKVIWEEGNFIERIITKGMESVRRDASTLTKKIQLDIYNFILSNNVKKIKPYLQKILYLAKKGKFSLDTIAIGKGLAQHLDSYKANTDYIRGAKYANDYYYRKKILKKGSRAFMVFINKIMDKSLPYTEVICFNDPKDFDPKRVQLNLSKTIERSLEKPLKHLLSMSDLQWADIKGRAKLKALL